MLREKGKAGAFANGRLSMAGVDIDAAQQRYSTVAIVLHWVLALGIAIRNR